MISTVEFAVKMEFHAIIFKESSTRYELTSVGQENFDWVVEEAAKICCGKKNKTGKNESYLGTLYAVK
jgi:hypothetical protein